MRGVIIISVILVALALWLASESNDQWALVEVVEGEIGQLRAEVAGISEQAAALEPAATLLVKFKDEGISDFYTRVLEAGEVLGNGVRIENRDKPNGSAREPTPPEFADLGYGLQVSRLTVETAAEYSASPALFSMLEEEVAALPVVVRRASAVSMGASMVKLRLEVDVFGR